MLAYYVSLGQATYRFVCMLLLRPVRVTKYCNQSVRLSVCSRNSKTARPNFTNFCACCPWPWLGSRSSSDGVEIRYVLPVLRMTSYHGAMVRKKTTYPLGLYYGNYNVLQCNTVFG